MNYSEIITIPCKVLKTLPEAEIDSIVNTVIDHYYTNGFPYYEFNLDKISKEYFALRDLDVSRLELSDNNLQQFMLGLNTVNTFHPEMWSTRCRNAKTPWEIYSNRELFATALKKRIKYSVTKLVDYNIRKSLKAFGVQSVSNFRPTIAKWVYEKYSPDGGVVLDPCSGYGGRLFGAMCSHIDSYTGIDPNPEATHGNDLLHSTLKDIDIDIKKYKSITLPFEDFNTDEKYDLVFTSPPYFNIEKYSEDENQSYIRYPEYGLWVDGFLRPLIQNSFEFLNKNGYLVLNVGERLISETVGIGMKTFGKAPEIYHMRLSKMLGQGDKNKVSHKTEPIFIWRKP
jgi:hypothetical protein